MRAFSVVGSLMGAALLAGCASSGGASSLAKFVAATSDVPPGYVLVPASKLDDVDAPFLTRNPGSIDIDAFDEDIDPAPTRGYAALYWVDEDEGLGIYSIALEWSSKSRADEALANDGPCEEMGGGKTYVMQKSAVVALVTVPGEDPSASASSIGSDIRSRTNSTRLCG